MRSTTPSATRAKVLRRAAVALAIGAAYYLFIRATGLMLFCPIRRLTGLACPGCGVTHLVTDLLAGHPLRAARENLAVAVLLPVWAAVLTVAAVRRRGLSGVTRARGITALAWVSVGVLILFGIARNLPGCAWLLPAYLQ